MLKFEIASCDKFLFLQGSSLAGNPMSDEATLITVFCNSSALERVNIPALLTKCRMICFHGKHCAYFIYLFILLAYMPKQELLIWAHKFQKSMQKWNISQFETKKPKQCKKKKSNIQCAPCSITRQNTGEQVSALSQLSSTFETHIRNL